MPFVAMSASVREVLPWSYLFRVTFYNGRRAAYDMSKNTNLVVYISVHAEEIKSKESRTLRTSSALCCNAMSFSGGTTGMLYKLD